MDVFFVRGLLEMNTDINTFLLFRKCFSLLTFHRVLSAAIIFHIEICLQMHIPTPDTMKTGICYNLYKILAAFASIPS